LFKKIEEFIEEILSSYYLKALAEFCASTEEQVEICRESNSLLRPSSVVSSMQEPGVHRSNSSARDAGYALTISGLDKGLHQDIHKVSTRVWADTKVLLYLPD
jgi:hypothetical protein